MDSLLRLLLLQMRGELQSRCEVPTSASWHAIDHNCWVCNMHGLTSCSVLLCCSLQQFCGGHRCAALSSRGSCQGGCHAGGEAAAAAAAAGGAPRHLCLFIMQSGARCALISPMHTHCMAAAENMPTRCNNSVRCRATAPAARTQLNFSILTFSHRPAACTADNLLVCSFLACGRVVVATAAAAAASCS